MGFYAALQTFFQAFISFRHGETGDGVTWVVGSVTIFAVAIFLETVKDRRTPREKSTMLLFEGDRFLVALRLLTLAVVLMGLMMAAFFAAA